MSVVPRANGTIYVSYDVCWSTQSSTTKQPRDQRSRIETAENLGRMFSGLVKNFAHRQRNPEVILLAKKSYENEEHASISVMITLSGMPAKQT